MESFKYCDVHIQAQPILLNFISYIILYYICIIIRDNEVTRITRILRQYGMWQGQILSVSKRPVETH
jgi:hypothetical protein